MSRWNVPFEFSLCGGKIRFTHTVAANKQANSHNFKIKNLNLLTITFLAIYLMNRDKSLYLIELSMRVNNTFHQIIDCFSNLLVLFFLMRSLIDRCQIVTDTCKNNVSNFVWKPFKSPLS